MNVIIISIILGQQDETLMNQNLIRDEQKNKKPEAVPHRARVINI
jgi:hypothetical protein